MAFFIAFCKKLLEYHFFKKPYKIGHRKQFNMLFFSSNPGPNFITSSNRLDICEKLIIASSSTKDVYIRPCISLTGHKMQTYTSLVWFIYLCFNG